MSVDEKPRLNAPRGLLGRLARGLAHALVPTERTIMTREGYYYFGVMAILLTAGLFQQVNLILLVATLAAGPFLTSWIGSRSLLRRLSVIRRVPVYVFAGDPLVVDYTLENGKRFTAAIAMFMEDTLASVDRAAGDGGAVAAGLLSPRAGSGPRQDALARRQPQAGQVPVSRSRPGDAGAVRVCRAQGHHPLE